MDLRSNVRKRELCSLTFINVDECDYSENYNLLIRKICSKKNVSPCGTYVYSSEKMHNAFKSLPERDKEIVIKRFGLMDGKYRSLKEVGDIIGVSPARIREIEERTIRRLKKENNAKCFIIHIDDLDGYVLSEEEKLLLENAKETILISKDEKEIETAKEEIKKYISSEACKITPDRITIEDLGLSMCIYYYLNKEGFKTLEDILNVDRLNHIKYNFSSKRKEELSDRVREFGYDINTGLKIKTIESKEEPVVGEESFESKETPVVKADSIEALRTATEELKTTIEEKAEKSKLLDEYIKLAKEHSKLKETESKIDEEIRRKVEILKGFGFKYEK